MAARRPEQSSEDRWQRYRWRIWTCRRRRIARPPGAWVVWAAEFLLSPETRRRVVEPKVATMREEYFGAIGREREALAFAVRVRTTVALLVEVAAGQPLRLLLQAFGFTRG